MEIEKRINRTVIEIGEEGTVEITKDFMSQLQYLCSEISLVEWSGYVFFSTKGTPKDLAKFKIVPYYIHPMDKGTGGATEFDDDGSLLELYEQMPELDPFNETKYRYGKIHSHNSMDVFHSSTDMQDLQDQSAQYEYYFSLIVNNRMDLEAKASFVAEIPTQPIKPKGFTGAKWSLPKEEVLGVIDFDIELEDTIISIPEQFKDRVAEIKKPKPITEYKPSKHPGYLLGDYYKEDEIDKYLKNTPISNSSEERKYIIGKALITKWLSDRFRVYNSAPIVLSAITGLSFVVINQMEISMVNWFDKLSQDEKNSIVLYLTQIPSSETNEQYDTILEWLWNTTEEIITQ